MKRLALLVVLASLAAFADDTRSSATNLVFTTSGVQVKPFTLDLVTGKPDGSISDRQGRLWSRLQAIAIENSITNMEALVVSYTNALHAAMLDLAVKTNSLPSAGLSLSLRFPLDNSSQASEKAYRMYVCDNWYDPATHCDVLKCHFTKATDEPYLSLQYVAEGFTTNTVAGLTKHASYPGSNWTNVETKVWRDWVYDNVRTFYFPRPADFQTMPMVLAPHAKWAITTWGNADIRVNGKHTYSGTVADTSTGVTYTFDHGGCVGVAPGTLGAKSRQFRIDNKRRLGAETYKERK